MHVDHDGIGHGAPFAPGRKAGAAAPAQTRCRNRFEDGAGCRLQRGVQGLVISLYAQMPGTAAHACSLRDSQDCLHWPEMAS